MRRLLRALYVSWRSREDRASYYPVGQLCQWEDDSSGQYYEFAYINGYLDAVKHGFHGFVEFNDFHGLYRSRQLFPLFANRIMSKSRPDYLTYLERLGLSPANVAEGNEIAPMTILARSGGPSTTDSIELFPIPEKDLLHNEYITYFLLRGIRYRTPEEQVAAISLTNGEKLHLRIEPGNDYDPTAVQIETQRGIVIGYVPAYLSEDTTHLINSNQQVNVFVDRVNQPPAPIQHRVLCMMRASWPDGFAPFTTNRFQPISKEIERINTLSIVAELAKG